FVFDATNSTIAGLVLDAAFGSAAISGGIAVVDTLSIRFEETRLAASGSWGLLSPASEPLIYTFESPNLSALDRLLGPTEFGPPRLAGSVRARGSVGGSVDYPIIETALTGSDLRYQDYAAASLSLNFDGRRSQTVGWEGRGAAEGRNLRVPGLDTVEE